MAQNIEIGSRNWYKKQQAQLIEELDKIRAEQRKIIIYGFEDRNFIGSAK